MKINYSHIVNLLNRILIFINDLLKVKFIKNKEIDILFDKITTQSLEKNLYLKFRIKDSFENRFELLIIHIILVVKVIKSDDLINDKYIQNLYDKTFQYLDSSFREMGLGDKAIEQNMSKLFGNFIIKVRLYEKALNENNDSSLKMNLLNYIYDKNLPQNETLYELTKYVRIQEKHLFMSVNKLFLFNEIIFKN